MADKRTWLRKQQDRPRCRGTDRGPCGYPLRADETTHCQDCRADLAGHRRFVDPIGIPSLAVAVIKVAVQDLTPGMSGWDEEHWPRRIKILRAYARDFLLARTPGDAAMRHFWLNFVPDLPVAAIRRTVRDRLCGSTRVARTPDNV